MLEVRLRNGTLLFRDGLQSFFSRFPEANVTNSTGFLNPKLIYDEHEGRFVMMVLQTGFSPPFPRIWLAVSKNETPDTVSGWNQAFLNSHVLVRGTNTFADVPGLAVDEEAVYVTTSQIPFLLPSATFGVQVWVIKKEVFGGFYSGGALSFFQEDAFLGGGAVAATVPAYVHGSGGVDGPIGTFFASIFNRRNGQVDLQIGALLNPFGINPVITIKSFDLGVLTQPEFVFPDAPQLDSKFKIDAGDSRALDAVWRNNSLWVVFTINPPSGVNQGQATVHWVRCRTSGINITLEAQGDVGGEDIALGTHTYFPSVAVNSQGLAAFGYSASSLTKFAGSYISVGTSEQSFPVKNGLAPYVRVFGGDRIRWGDYSSVAVDPTDDSFWSFNAFADTRGTVDSSGGDGRSGTAWGRWACEVRFRIADVWNTLSRWACEVRFRIADVWNTLSRLLILCSQSSIFRLQLLRLRFSRQQLLQSESLADCLVGVCFALSHFVEFSDVTLVYVAFELPFA
jgi:hypothetical protein